MRKLFSLFLVILSIQLSAQEISLEYQQLSNILLEKINELRADKEIGSLELNIDLSNASHLHSSYMARYNRLRHEESSRKLKTPFLRVQKYSNEYEFVGENILFIGYKGKKLKKKDIEIIAEEIFTNWKNSPKHFENMINPQFKLCGFGFAIGKNKLYATNVFGTKGYVIEGQVSNNAFGIKPYNKICDNFLSENSNLMVNIGNSLQIENDKVYLYIHNKQLIDRVFDNPKDGIAIDIVTREQFQDKNRNLIDFSPIYDGIMLKPVYLEELKQKNSSISDFRYIGAIADIPETFYEKEINANVIFIKEGVSCDYRYPAYVPREDYNLIDIEPILLNPNQPPFKNKGISACKTIYFDFDRNNTVPLKSFNFEDIQGRLKSVEIVGFSSVEGDSIRNSVLQKQRAEYIQKLISNKFTESNFPCKIQTNENWPLMYFQLKVLGIDSMQNRNKTKIKNLIKTDTTHNWDSLLYLQRRSYATVYFENELSIKDSLYFNQNYHTAMFYNDVNLSNRSLAAIFNNNSLEFFTFTPNEIETILVNPLLVQNTTAILSKIYNYNFEQSIQFIDYWFRHLDQLDQNSKYNLCNLYCIVVADILDSWDVNKKVFSKILSPDLVKDCISEFSGYEDYDKMLLNYHITASRYYGQNNDYTNLKESFDFIVDYFKNSSLNINDEIKLCLFFNNWSRYDLCIEFLKKRRNDPDFNEEAAFLLAQTSLGYPDVLTEEELSSIVKKAFQINKKRWCNWINREFQHQRNTMVKEIYCNECSTSD